MLYKLILKLLFVLLFNFEFKLIAQKHEYANQIISTLASKKYYGRGYCKNADIKAANYIKNEFHKSGLTPICQDYFQYFNLNINTFPGIVKVKLNDHVLEPGKDFLVDPASSSIKGHYNILIVKRKDFLDQELLKRIIFSASGKALFIDMEDSLSLDKESTDKVNAIIDAFKYDPRIGNPLTILFSNKKLTWSTSDVRSEKASLIFDSNKITLSEINEISVNISSELKNNYRTQNVIAKILGSGQSDSTIVITAHYDHLGIMGRKTYFPGANDNASGVAMMLNICKYFSNFPLKYNMVFIAFSGEEAGLRGSQFFIHNPLFEIEKIKFMINFDLAGTGDEGIKVVNGTTFKKEFDSLTRTNDRFHYLNSVQPRGEACISDHCPFYNKNVPCFYIYTLGGISAYHDVFDKYETLPLNYFESYYQLMISFLKDL